MSKLISTFFPPLKDRGNNFFEIFKELSSKSTEITMTSGYISDAAIYFLKENINALPKIKLGIGMMAIEGFTKSQYENLLNLDEQLTHKRKGGIFVSKIFKHHGKAYTFYDGKNAFSSIIGSTNISILGESTKRQHEIDIHIDDPSIIKSLIEIQEDLLKNSISISSFTPKKYKDYTDKDILEKFTESEKVSVEKIDQGKVIDFATKKTGLKFNLPLKCSEKSNMNVIFGRGRENTNNKIITPRNWLETEVIVDVSITRKPNYPAHKSFWVITDDGWKFKIKTSGDNAKNFRSENDLHVLGAWIKGRLLKKGIISYGQFISEADLHAYGRKELALEKLSIKTEGLDTFFLDFSV